MVDTGAKVRLPSVLREPPPGTLYHRERHGVSVVAVPTTALSAPQVAALLAFRFAQYVEVGFVNLGYALVAGMTAEPASTVGPDDIHLITGLPTTGEILCYTVIEQPPVAPAGTRLVVEKGRASFEITDGAGMSTQVGELHAGQCCGYAAVLAGAAHSVDVVARTDMSLLRLSKHAHDTYLSGLVEVSDRLSRDALQQLVLVDQGRHRHQEQGGCGCEAGCHCGGEVPS